MDEFGYGVQRIEEEVRMHLRFECLEPGFGELRLQLRFLHSLQVVASQILNEVGCKGHDPIENRSVIRAC